MDLDELRQEIDACDRILVETLNRRAKAAGRIGGIKRQNGKAVFAPEREKAVYEKIASLNQGPLSQRNLQGIYREIMSACIAMERPTRIACLGPRGTFTHQAAISKFGTSMEYLLQPEIRDVFLAVTRRHADYGVVPIENSTEGSVSATEDMLIETDLKICSEVFLEIHQNLIASCPLEQVKLVVSHPNALAQCRDWLATNLPGIPSREVPSTALAAERASREPGVAAIASEVAARLYNLEVLMPAIEDRPDNTTRFLVLGHEPAGASGDDRTSIVFSCKHESGSLYSALLPFKTTGVNLTRIESRPSKRIKWEYLFFVDLEGHVGDARIAETLRQVKEQSDEFKLLGSYPRSAHLVAAPPHPGV